MSPWIFALLALLLLGSAAAVVWLKSPRQAAYALVLAVLAACGMVAWLEAEFIALALVLILASGTALLLMVGLPVLSRLGKVQTQRPDEDRGFWAGLVTVLFFVITYRVLATTPWGLEDRSQMALADAQRGLEAIRTLGQAFTGEFALALIGGLLLIAAALATTAALAQPENDA